MARRRRGNAAGEANLAVGYRRGGAMARNCLAGNAFKALMLGGGGYSKGGGQQGTAFQKSSGRGLWACICLAGEVFAA